MKWNLPRTLHLPLIIEWEGYFEIWYNVEELAKKTTTLYSTMLFKLNCARAPKLTIHSLKPLKLAFELESNAVYETCKVGT